MVVLRVQTEIGYAPPPQTPYSIITHLPGWDTLHGVREGDTAPLAKVVHIYPRIGPTHSVAKLCQEIAKRVGLEGKSCMAYLNPQMWPYSASHVTRKERGNDAIKPENLTFKCVDVAGHRLYAVLFERAHAKALMHSWGTPGLGLSIRGAEGLLKGVGSMAEVPSDGSDPPKPTWTPEGLAHQALRERVNELVHRAAIDPQKVTSQPKDVFLYPSGMGAVYHTTNLVQEYRPGSSVALGVVFDDTHHHLIEESPKGYKHVGKIDKEAVDGMETWMENEAKAGRTVSFVIAEFSSNPIVDTPDLHRLKQLSETYGFVLIVDDTLSGFGNVDILACSDILLTSLTKSFSGKSDVLGGSIVLNPLSPQYGELSSRLARTHRNELFAADAAVLLANSQDFFARTRRLNRSAEAMAGFLHKTIGHPDSPVARVLYPSLLPSKPHYDAFLRRSTPEIPEPGYGCLLTVDFESRDTARAFYDRCGFYSSPHLGGHVTIMTPYTMFALGRIPNERADFREMGALEESVRISAGLEDVEDLIDTLKDALDAAAEVKKKARAQNGSA